MMRFCVVFVCVLSFGFSSQQDLEHLLPEWVEAGSVGQFLNLTTRSEKLHIPLQINVLMVGFQGDGFRQLDIPQERLAHFFEHIAHRLDHVVVPIGEEQTTLKQIVTRETFLEHDVNVRFIMADPLVTVALENLLLQNARRGERQYHFFVDFLFHFFFFFRFCR
jgi:hypothetical protein